MSIFILVSSVSIQSHRLSNSVEDKDESTYTKQTSKKSTVNYFDQSQPISSSNLAEITSTIRPNDTVQPLVTKPNSYLYNPNDDDDAVLLERVKRESAPFVCKSKLSLFEKKNHHYFSDHLL